jgi:hypothetical protein
MTVYGVASIAMLCLMWKQEPWYIALLRIDYPSVLKSKQDSE